MYLVGGQCMCNVRVRPSCSVAPRPYGGHMARFNKRFQQRPVSALPHCKSGKCTNSFFFDPNIFLTPTFVIF